MLLLTLLHNNIYLIKVIIKYGIGHRNRSVNTTHMRFKITYNFGNFCDGPIRNLRFVTCAVYVWELQGLFIYIFLIDPPY
jgi:hypothetical protein